MVTKEEVMEALKDVLDPEIMIDVVTLELIYDVKIEGKKAHILMTFTTPLCPYGPMLKKDIKDRVEQVEGIQEVEIEVTFTPRWEPSEELRAMFGV